MEMNERRRKVLAAIVRLYAGAGEPVGSQLLSEMLDQHISSATLRNEMAALTRMGYLFQPHTSAGRVPSISGYRYYTQVILGQLPVPPHAQKQAETLVSELNFDSDKLLEEAARTLSDLAGYAVAAVAPGRGDLSMAHYELVPVGKNRIAVLGVSQTGSLVFRVASTRQALTEKDLEILSALLNLELTFLSEKDVTREKVNAMARSLGIRAGVLAPVLKSALRMVHQLTEPKVTVAGQVHLLDHPELDPALRGVVSLFADHERLAALVLEGEEAVRVLYGDEIEGYHLPGVCVLTSRYPAGGGLTGGLALIGSARMDYEKLMPLLDSFSTALGKMMTAGGKEE